MGVVNKTSRTHTFTSPPHAPEASPPEPAGCDCCHPGVPRLEALAIGAERDAAAVALPGEEEAIERGAARALVVGEVCTGAVEARRAQLRAADRTNRCRGGRSA